MEVKISTIGRQVAITITSINQETLAKLRNIPCNRKKWRGTTLLFEPSGVALDYVRSTFPQASWNSEAQQFLNTLEKIQKSIIPAPVTTTQTYQYKTTPYRHQDYVFNLSRDRVPFALFMEQGTGKTKVTLDTAAYLWSKGKIRGLLVVAYPNGVHTNWIKTEIPAHLPEWCGYQAVAWDGREKKLDTLYRMSFEDTELRVLTINVEALSTRRGEEVCRKFLMTYPSLFVVDESSSIKKIGTKRTKAIVRLGALAPYRRILTGTAGGPLNLYSQFLFLDEDILGFGSMYAYRNRYCVLRELPNITSSKGRKIEVVVGYQHTDELQTKIKPHSYRILKKDCLDLPEKVYVPPIPVELTPEQKQIYNEFVEEMMTEFKGRLITADLAITRMLRCHQVVCGFMPPENPEDFGDPIPGGNPRLAKALEYIDTCLSYDEELKQFEPHQEKMIVWATYRYNIKEVTEALVARYGKGVAIPFSGKTPMNLRAGIVETYQDDNSKLKFLVANKALAYGWNLIATGFNLYYSNSFDLEVRLQSEDRSHRIGLVNPVTYTDMVAPGTIDSTIIKKLREKYSLSATIMGDEIREWMRGV